VKERDPGVKWFNTIFYPKLHTARAVRYEDGVLPRIRETNICLFTPWGPRYSWETRGVEVQDSDKEVEVLNFLVDLFAQINQNMPAKSFRWLFLGADTYGSKINHLPAEVISGYFGSLAWRLHQVLPTAEFRLWSEFNESAERYREEIRANFRKFVGSNLLARAEITAKSMGRGGDAKEYLVERIAEAMLIEKEFRPVKVSCVGRHKDDKVDGDLPRIYLLPEQLHAPWL